MNVKPPPLQAESPELLSRDVAEAEPPPVQRQTEPKTPTQPTPTPPCVDGQAGRDPVALKGGDPPVVKPSPPVGRSKKAAPAAEDTASEDTKKKSPIVIAPALETRQEEKRPAAAKRRSEHKPAATDCSPSPPPLPASNKSDDSSVAPARNAGTKPTTRPSTPQPAADTSHRPARPPLPSAKTRGKATPKSVRSDRPKTPAASTTVASGSEASRMDIAAPTVAVSDPPPDLPIKAAVLPGYQPTEDQVAIVRAIGVSLAAVAAISAIPAIMDIIDHMRAEASLGVARWAYLVLMLAALQGAYSAYVYQLPDWSTVWVVTIVTLVIATGYAMMLGLTFITHGDAWLVRILDLGDVFRGGRDSLWCFVMLCLTSLISYFSGRISVRWRGELIAT
ncbi:MAG: hypothetical protein QF918_09045 [Pirellulaceae bacterium]|nr:hypothetical protein [Pirellulaceae bacterium]MDP6555279.1 hypothetical protein [Pirellulaceae bacterium]